jgi:hypothetical protein
MSQLDVLLPSDGWQGPGYYLQQKSVRAKDTSPFIPYSQRFVKVDQKTFIRTEREFNQICRSAVISKIKPSKKKLEAVKKNRTVEDLKKQYPDAVLIHDWDEFRKIHRESETHVLNLGDYSGNIQSKSDDSLDGFYYLSTHTFYANHFAQSTDALQASGFNVIIDNWDDVNVSK